MFRCWMAAALLAACWGTGTAHAQTNRQPWQMTFVKTSHIGDTSRLIMDLPQPPPGRILTIERVAVTLGPTLSIYGKLLSCEIESSHPRVMKAELAADRVRFPLPLPEVLQPQSKTWTVLNGQTLIYADSNAEGTLRVSCETDAVAHNDRFVVSASGYTTDK